MNELTFGRRGVPEPSDQDFGPRIHKFEYNGKLGKLYGIFIANLLLNMVTLTIWRFWGKTNLRRYIWSSMSVQGEAFEYTGRGGELFIGFLLVMAFYVVIFVAIAILGVVIGTEAQIFTQFVLIFGILYLTFVAQYAAQRYRLTRTLWCGIRGGMTGSAWAYGLKALLLSFLSLITLNFAWPWTQMRLTEDRINHSYLGDAKATVSGSASNVFVSYLIGLIISIGGMAALLFGIWTFLQSTGAWDVFMEAVKAGEEGRSADVTEAEARTMGVSMIIAYVLLLAGSLFISVVAFSAYAAAFFREIASHLHFSDVRFSSHVTAWQYAKLWIGNLLWVFLTLGLGFPVAVHRSLKFFADRLEIRGQIEPERLVQTGLERPKFGEGLLEVFDPGFL